MIPSGAASKLEEDLTTAAIADKLDVQPIGVKWNYEKDLHDKPPLNAAVVALPANRLKNISSKIGQMEHFGLLRVWNDARMRETKADMTSAGIARPRCAAMIMQVLKEMEGAAAAAPSARVCVQAAVHGGRGEEQLHFGNDNLRLDRSPDLAAGSAVPRRPAPLRHQGRHPPG